jgi:hypothetical protein
LLVLGMLVLYIYQARVNVAPQVADQLHGGAVEKPTTDRSEANTAQAPGATLSGYRRSKRQTGYAKRSAIMAVRTTDPSLVTRTSPVTEPDSSPMEQITMPDGSTDSREMLRIEIQTSDPKIRIIWFAPKEVDSQFSKPVTDTKE